MIKKNNEYLWNKTYIVLLFVNMLLFLDFNISTAGIPVYAESLKMNEVIVGSMTTITAMSALVIRPIAGWVATFTNRKRTLLIGIACLMVACTSYILAPVLGVITSARIIHGVGWGISSTMISTMAIDAIPSDHTGEGIGYMGFVASIGTAIAPLMMVSLLDIGGIKSVLLVMAGCCYFCFVVMLLSKQNSQCLESNKRIPFRLSECFEYKSVIPAISICFITIGYSAVITFITPFTIHNEIVGIQKYFLLYAIFTMLIRPFSGRIADRKGFFLLGSAAFIFMAIGIILVGCAGNVRVLGVAGILIGTGMGLGMSVIQTMAVKRLDYKRRGLGIATFLFGFDIGMAIGSLIAGYIVTTYGYTNMFMLMSVFPIIGVLFFFSTYKRWKLLN